MLSFANDKDPLILSFILGDDISLHSVMDLPTLWSICSTLNLTRVTLVCWELKFTFHLMLDQLGKGLPNGVSFHESHHMCHIIVLLIYNSLFIILLWMVLLPRITKSPFRTILSSMIICFTTASIGIYLMILSLSPPPHHLTDIPRVSCTSLRSNKG